MLEMARVVWVAETPLNTENDLWILKYEEEEDDSVDGETPGRNSPFHDAGVWYRLLLSGLDSNILLKSEAGNCNW